MFNKNIQSIYVNIFLVLFYTGSDKVYHQWLLTFKVGVHVFVFLMHDYCISFIAFPFTERWWGNH